MLAQSIKDPLASPPSVPSAGTRQVDAVVDAPWFMMGVLIAAALVLLALVVKDVLRPGSFDGKGAARDVQGLPAPAWLGCALLVFIASVLGAGVSTGILKGAGVPADSPKFSGLTMLGAYATSGGVAALLLFLVKPNVRSAGLRARWSDVPRGLAILLLTLPVLQCVGFLGVMVYTWTQGHPPNLIAHSTLSDILEERSNPWTWLVIGCAVIGAATIEELSFRVFLQSAVLRATRSHWLAILITSTLFALIHWSNVPWHALPILFTLGAAAGIAYERTGRLLVPIVMHMGFNALNVALVLLTS